MQVAALLSDLKSLSACDHAAALSLVSVSDPQNPLKSTSCPSGKDPAPSSTSTSTSSSTSDPDPALRRAIDLLSLHEQKTRWREEGLDPELVRCREAVAQVARDMGL